jgi:hypothetical protein
MPKDINKIGLYTKDAAFAGDYSKPLYTVSPYQSYMKCQGIDMGAPTEYMLIGFFPFDGADVPISIGDPIIIDKESSYQTSLPPADPEWYVTLSAEDKKKLEPCYANWKKTTTNLAVPIINVYKDNPDYSNNIIWRTSNNRILFHADEEIRPPFLGKHSDHAPPVNFIFFGGLTPPKPYGKLQMEAGIHIEAAESFSYLFVDTFNYLAPSQAKYLPPPLDPSPYYLYLVDAPGGLEVSLSTGNANDDEVSFPGGVLSKWIVGAFMKVGKTDARKFDTFARNPDYEGDADIGAAPDGYVDVVISTRNPAWMISFATKIDHQDVSSAWIRLSVAAGPYTLSAIDEKRNPLSGSWFFNDKVIATNEVCAILDLKQEQGINKVLVVSFDTVS